jgi:predicted neuraminidase
MTMMLFLTSLLPALSGGCPMAAAPTTSTAGDLRFNVAPATAFARATNEAPVCQTTAIFRQIPGRPGSHAPAITAFADGTLLAAWYSYVGPNERDGAAIYTARRAAGASTWDNPVLHIDRPVTDGNPVLYSEGDNVWMFQAVVPGGWSTSHIEVQRSSDRGLTWTTPQRIAGPLGANVRYPPVRTKDGDLLLPAYDDLLQRSLFFVSTDADAWSLRASLATELTHQCIQPSIVALPSGRILGVMRNVGNGWLWVTASDDAGRTWLPPRDAGLPNPATASALARLSSGALVLVYNDSNTVRHPLSVRLSTDDGVTWSPARILVDGPGEYAYPAAVPSADGRLQIVYSHNREWIEHVTVNTAWILSPG